jgi:hypothetical protein
MKLSPDNRCVTTFIVTFKRDAAAVAAAFTWGQAGFTGYLLESICISTATACVFFAPGLHVSEMETNNNCLLAMIVRLGAALPTLPEPQRVMPGE